MTTKQELRDAHLKLDDKGRPECHYCGSNVFIQHEDAIMHIPRRPELQADGSIVMVNSGGGWTDPIDGSIPYWTCRNCGGEVDLSIGGWL